MQFEFLETERIKLRKLNPEVYDHIYKNYTDKECIAFLGLTNEQELATEKEKHSKGLKAYDRTFQVFHLIEKKNEEVIGMCGFVRHYPAHFRAEFGYSLYADEYKNKGYMSEVTPTIIHYGFDKMKLQRIEAMVGAENYPSLKIMEKLGFSREGLMKRHYLRNGIFEDSVIFSLLKTGS